MLILISPAKTLDFDSPVAVRKYTQPQFIPQSEALIEKLRDYSPRRLSNLMNLSDKLANLNAERYQQWDVPFSLPSARQALYAFRGGVYLGLEADTLGLRDVNFAQKHLRILSGLHGVLRPLDLIRPHRLEMGTSLKNTKGKDLYAYWKATITDALNTDLPASRSLVVNLASQEYFKAVDVDRLDGQLVTPVFKDRKVPDKNATKGGRKNAEYRMIGFFAKRARGRMARYLIDERIKSVAGIKKFDADGYRFNAALSVGNELVFTRDEVPSP